MTEVISLDFINMETTYTFGFLTCKLEVGGPFQGKIFSTI